MVLYQMIVFLYLIELYIWTKLDNDYCKDSICNDPKLILGSNAKGPNNKFIKRGYKRTRLTSKEKRLNLTFLDGSTQIFRSISPLIKLNSLFHKVFL